MSNLIKEASKSFIGDGFNTIPVDSEKRPAIPSWAEYQQKKQNIEFAEAFNSALGLALVGGFNDLEIIDFDKQHYHEDFKALMTEFKTRVIGEFGEPFFKSLYLEQTRSGGFHIAFRAPNPGGNQKLAQTENGKECFIETRGAGGYCIVAPSPGYTALQRTIPSITAEQRDGLMDIARSFNRFYKEPKKHAAAYSKNGSSGVLPIKDYNEKVQVLDLLINAGWEEVGAYNEGIAVRRPEKSKGISGIVNSNNRFFCFSSSTEFDLEHSLSSFDVFLTLNRIDLDEGLKRIKDDYGVKSIGTTPKQPEPVTFDIQDLEKIQVPEYPSDSLPEILKETINAVAEADKAPPAFVAAPVMFVASTATAGMMFEPKDLWENSTSLWGILVGKTGAGKTPMAKAILKPLYKWNKEKEEEFDLALSHYESIDPKEKRGEPEPLREEIVIKNTTIEALFDCMFRNPNGVGMYSDEIMSWLGSMGQYKAGKQGEHNTYLELWNEDTYSISRIGNKKTKVIDNTILSIGGTIQWRRLQEIRMDGDGFAERFMMYLEPAGERKRKAFNSVPIDKSKLKDFNDLIQKCLSIRNNPAWEPYRRVKLSEQDKSVQTKYAAAYDLLSAQADEHPEIESVISKYQIYLSRLCLIFATIDHMSEDFPKPGKIKLTETQIDNAYDVIQYHLKTFRIYADNTLQSEAIIHRLRRLKGSKDTELKKQAVKKAFELMPYLNVTEISKMFGVTRQTIYNWLKE